MNDKQDILQIIGCLMKSPSILSKVDKYSLSIADFSTKFEKYVFEAIRGLYLQGAGSIDVIDIENYLNANSTAIACFNTNNGIEYLTDAKEFSSIDTFDYYYSHLKKINLLKSLKKDGFSISDFYDESVLDISTEEKNRYFEELTIQDILDATKKKILRLEKEFIRNDVSETKNVFQGLQDLVDESYTREDIGLPLQGEIFNEIMSGARKGTLTIRSGGSGLGKSRNMVGDACYLAFPLRYSQEEQCWVREGSCEKVLYIATEQDFKEIQRMILAYLTGINESQFKYGVYTKQEEKIIQEALKVLEYFQDNLQITKIPNPTNELIKSVIRENYIINQVDYVFYDYIFIGPALLNEFKGFGLRNDELLLILSTTLKDLASELNVFIMTATQVNAHADDNKEIRNESSLAGGRATINKADYGFIMSRPTKEELTTLEPYINTYNIRPNLVTDVFKVRAGEWTQVRIWSLFDAGTLRKKDLFLTDSRLELIEVKKMFDFSYGDAITEEQLKEIFGESGCISGR